eukprot:TRINITY_DN1227_c0_g1::TRINITY_DN1227_c0_g1_i1::g.26910::m.26910 TRINITY_DN1227_c0_g1::TRINITY_DN1227_c0_g1_i1::g.26910  ORF type:complete len:812 (-),score=133.62,sp/Q24629/REF2P_DROSI/39.74/1e-09,ZZ/PF00569.12/3.8e-11 TRINITY_DN1227_c0_g1_i1:74-2509(-)
MNQEPSEENQFIWACVISDESNLFLREEGTDTVWLVKNGHRWRVSTWVNQFGNDLSIYPLADHETLDHIHDSGEFQASSMQELQGTSEETHDAGRTPSETIPNTPGPNPFAIWARQLAGAIAEVRLEVVDPTLFRFKNLAHAFVRNSYMTLDEFVNVLASDVKKLTNPSRAILCEKLQAFRNPPGSPAEDRHPMLKQIRTFLETIGLMAPPAAQLPEPSSNDAPQPSSDVPMHIGVKCDGCGMCPIHGIRYSCTRCHNLDFCEACEESGRSIEGHDRQHIMAKIRHPQTQVKIKTVSAQEWSGSSSSTRWNSDSIPSSTPSSISTFAPLPSLNPCPNPTVSPSPSSFESQSVPQNSTREIENLSLSYLDNAASAYSSSAEGSLSSSSSTSVGNRDQENSTHYPCAHSSGADRFFNSSPSASYSSAMASSAHTTVPMNSSSHHIQSSLYNSYTEDDENPSHNSTHSSVPIPASTQHQDEYHSQQQQQQNHLQYPRPFAVTDSMTLMAQSAYPRAPVPYHPQSCLVTSAPSPSHLCGLSSEPKETRMMRNPEPLVLDLPSHTIDALSASPSPMLGPSQDPYPSHPDDHDVLHLTETMLLSHTNNMVESLIDVSDSMIESSLFDQSIADSTVYDTGVETLAQSTLLSLSIDHDTPANYDAEEGNDINSLPVPNIPYSSPSATAAQPATSGFVSGLLASQFCTVSASDSLDAQQASQSIIDGCESMSVTSGDALSNAATINEPVSESDVGSSSVDADGFEMVEAPSASVDFIFQMRERLGHEIANTVDPLKAIEIFTRCGEDVDLAIEEIRTSFP